MSLRTLRWPALAALCLVAGFSLPAQFTPEVALTKFTVAPGLEISTWASEPLLVNPTCIDVDEGGRVWVCESVNYRTKLRGKPLNRPEGDRILVLEDTKGTGKADKVHVFYQAPDVLAPLGICVIKDPVGPGRTVIVSQSPDIWIFEDKDGDFKADGPPKKLLTGFGGFDHDHGVHSCVVGPDRRLYFLVGDQGVRNLKGNGDSTTYSSNDTDCRAGTVWRCDLDGKNLTLIAHNFRNPYELAVDSFGGIFLSDNDDDGNQQTRICYIMPGGNYGYHPRGPGQSHWHEEQPGVVHKILRTYFGSPTGMCIYEGDLLPEKYRGFPLHVDAGPRQARSYMLKRAGAGYEVDREDIVNSTDNWFRPSDICNGPDGSVYIADWYDPGVGGHGMGDTTRGRIYRLAPKGHKVANPKVDLEKPEGILAALGSPNQTIRVMAQTRLTQTEPEAAWKIVGQAIGSSNVHLQARGYWMTAVLFKQHNDRRFLALLDRSLESKDERFRELFVRACVDYLGKLPSEIFPGTTEKVVDDTSPAVRRELLLCLRLLPAEKVKDLIWALAKKYDGKDRFYLNAVGIAVGQPTQPERRAAILADFDKHFATLDDRALDLVWELRPPSVLPRLGEKIADRALTPAQRARIVDILASSNDKDAGKAMLTLLRNPEVPAEVRAKVIENLKLFLPGKWQALKTEGSLRDTVQALLKEPAQQLTAVQLIGAAGLVAQAKDVADVAANSKQDQATRLAAIAVLGDLPAKESADALKALADLDGPYIPAIAGALGKLIGKGDTPFGKAALAELQGFLTADASSPARVARRAAALEALVGTRPGTVWLLDLASGGKLPGEVKADAGRLLRNTPYQDLRNKALIAFPVPGKLDLKNLPAIASLVQRKGDVERGKKLMADSLKGDTQCLKCHTVRGIGGQVGPDLSMIGKKASKENLFESILFPSKAIADQYVSWIVETKAGLVITGLLVEETPTHLTLRDANGKDTKIAKTEIDSRMKSLKSLMPEDVVVHLSEDDLVDMVAYLGTLQSAAFSPDSWHILGPFPNGEGDAGLDKTLPGEEKIDLAGNYEGKHGKVSWRTVKPGATGYVDLQAFFAPNSNDITSLLTREFESVAEQKATLLLGADDAAKVWVNGKLVHTSRDHAAAMPTQYTVEVPLQKGTNRVVIKITNGDGAHGLFFTLLAGQELKAGK
jgi:putative membrane-bound dehydrogenase-like protein